MGEAEALTAEERADLEFFAAQRGLDGAELRSRHTGVGPFSELTTELERELPESFVRAALTSDDGSPSGLVQFTDEPPPDVMRRLANLPLDVLVEYGAPASARELLAVSAAMTEHLAARRDVIESAETRYDYQRITLTLGYTVVVGASTEAVASALTEALVAAPRLLRTVGYPSRSSPTNKSPGLPL